MAMADKVASIASTAEPPRRRTGAGPMSSLLCAGTALVCAAALVPATALAQVNLAAFDTSVNLSLQPGPPPTAAMHDADAQFLFLDVVVNGVATHRVMEFVRFSDGRFLAWAKNLQAVGVRCDAVGADGYVDLATLPDLRYHYDGPMQRMVFDAALSRLDLQTQHLNTEPAALWQATRSTGALLDYDLFGSFDDHDGELAAATDMRAFGAWGVFDSTGLSRITERGGDDRGYLRLDSTWSFSSQQELWTINLGDFVSGSLSWSRPTRMAGVQWRRDFGLQPQLLTDPIPQFFGEAALPSAVELYVNGVRQYSGQVAPGPFTLNTVPNLNGSGAAQVVITDALGRSRSIDFSFYSANRLLRAGLSDYAVEIGAVRRDYGLRSFSYDDVPAANASWRHGLRDWLTLEAHGEATRGIALAGAGALLRLGGAGVLNASSAWSDGSDADGGQFGFGYGWTGGGFSFNYNLLYAQRGYRDIAARDGRAPSRRSETGLISYGLGAAGSLGLSYARLDSRELGHTRLAGLSYSVSLYRQLLLYASASRDLDRSDGDSISVGLSWVFARHVSTSTSWQHQSGTDRFDAAVQKPEPADGGYGWSLRTQQGDGIDNYQTEFRTRGDYAELALGGLSVNGRNRGYASASGSVVSMGGDWFAGRRINQGFALIDTNGYGGLPVKLENRTIGETDSRGHYLLSNLNPYEPNHISIDPLALPADVQFEQNRVIVVPAQRAGVRADFGLHTVRAAVLVLNDDSGTPLPLGSRVYLDGTAVPVETGYDGQVYLEGLAPHNRLRVHLGNGEGCTLGFDFDDRGGGIPTLGPYTCHGTP